MVAPFRIVLGQADIIPFGYGLAWRRTCEFRSVFMPIPFNVVARLLIWLYWRLVHPPLDFDVKAYRAGSREAWRNAEIVRKQAEDRAFERGYRDGLDEFRRQALEIIRKEREEIALT